MTCINHTGLGPRLLCNCIRNSQTKTSFGHLFIHMAPARELFLNISFASTLRYREGNVIYYAYWPIYSVLKFQPDVKALSLSFGYHGVTILIQTRVWRNIWRINRNILGYVQPAIKLSPRPSKHIARVSVCPWMDTAGR